MTATIQGKPVTGLVVGSDTFVPDSGWIPLELPDGVTGQVFFKDNGDGTASLTGSVSTPDRMNIGVENLILSPPSGYAFISDNWTMHNGSSGIELFPTYVFADGSVEQTNFGTGFTAIPSYKLGNLYLKNTYVYSGYDSSGMAGPVEVIFSKNLTVKYAASLATPVIINIEKV
ncbi:hypothetical protein [Levilactobacillus brevis]|uniref:hypothetical protein n=1 Tax=Levilactobacillus brevis TaxID=1580 RepID=UPI000BE9C8EE|nr:hypothetical protein [Levilactobacillus brevis]STX19365.1 Uncharacterised protein [Levilactobacillus brevis]